MSGRFLKQRSTLKYVSQQAAVATAIAMTFSVVTSLVFYGMDMRAQIDVGYVFWCSLALSILAATSLSVGLSLRSAKLLCELDQARAELFELSRTDSLSGLLNRRGFAEVAIGRIAEANRSHERVAVLMCDIDLFKSINDKFGHEIGDVALARIGKVFKEIEQRDGILIGRYGGEEFAVLIEDAGWESACNVAETLRQACSSQLISTGSTAFNMTMSIGVVVKEQCDLPELLRSADAALYAAKTAGRNRVARFDKVAA